MMTDPAFCSRYSPRRALPAVLEATFVLGETLAADLVARLGESVGGDSLHHLLLVGPRGAGKSHLAALVTDRLTERADLDDRLRLAWIDADETPASFLKLLLRIQGTLATRYPGEFDTAAVDPADPADTIIAEFAHDHAAAARLVAGHLVSAVGDRRVLLVLENLDRLFRNLGDRGQKELRAFLQEQPRFAILATARELIGDLAKRRAPFFGFFQVEHLQPLTTVATAALLSSLTTLRGDHDLVAFLATAGGGARVRALHHLTAGNPRLCVVLAGYLGAASLDELVTPVCQALDELRPYYLEAVRDLPPQQREIIEFLCSRTRPVPVKAIQTALLGAHSTAASELKKLRDKGYVQNQRRGRESLYEVSEPWLRLCWQFHNRGDRAPRQLVELLRACYDDCHPDREAAGYAGRLGQILRSSADPSRWREAVGELVRECRERDATPRLAAALLANLRDLAELSPLTEVRAAWAATWDRVAQSHPELGLATRLFHAGVNASGSDGEGALLDLLSEERRILETLHDSEHGEPG